MARRLENNQRMGSCDQQMSEIGDPAWLVEQKRELLVSMPELVDHLMGDEHFAQQMAKLAMYADRTYGITIRTARSRTKGDLGMCVLKHIFQTFGVNVPVFTTATKIAEDDRMAAVPCAIAGPKAYANLGGRVEEVDQVVASGRVQWDGDGIISTERYLPIIIAAASDVVMGVRNRTITGTSEVHNKLKRKFDIATTRALLVQKFSNRGEWADVGKVPIDCFNAEALVAFSYGQDRRDARAALAQVSKLYHLSVLPADLLADLEINPNANMGIDLLHPEILDRLAMVDPETQKEYPLTEPRHRYRLMSFQMAKLGFSLERLLFLADSMPYLCGEGRNIDNGNALLRGTSVDGGHWLNLTNADKPYQIAVNRALWVRR